MADHLHGTRYLIGSHKTSALTFGDDLVGHLILLGLEDCRLMKTDGRRVNAHVGKDNIDILHTRRESQMIGQGQCDMKENIIMAAMALPKLSVQIMIVVLWAGAMDMEEVLPKETGQHHHASER